MTAPENQPDATPQEGDSQEPQTFDAEYVKKLRAEAAKYRTEAKSNADAAARLAALEESQKTEAQKLADRAAVAERERDEARLDALRTKVGAAKKLPLDVVDLLKGSTEEELAAHADRLSEHFKASVRPSGSVDQGSRGKAPAATPRDEFAAFLTQQMGT